MTSTSLLLKGKYLGNTFSEVLAKDIHYCKFISDMKFVSNELKEFQDWLHIHLPSAMDKFIESQLVKINKRLTS